MINWMYYPKTRRYDPLSQQIVQTFQNVQSSIDSDTHSLHSNDVLAELRTGLESIGFSVEKSKRAEDKIHVPVLLESTDKLSSLSMQMPTMKKQNM